MTDKHLRNTINCEQKQLIGRRLVVLRQALGLQQIEWAKRLGISVWRLNRWESGTHEPDLGMLVVIAMSCRISVDWILTGRLQLTIEPRTADFLRNNAADLFADSEKALTKRRRAAPSRPTTPPGTRGNR